MEDDKFQDCFDAKKRRIAKMKVQYIVETDPVAQAILEILAATHLEAKHNDFENH